MPNFDLHAVLQGEYLTMWLGGAYYTFSLFILAWIGAFLLAVVIITLRTLNNRFIEFFIAAYINYHRNVPGLVQIFVWYFGIPVLLPDQLSAFINDHNSEFIFALIALTLNSAAYMAEDMRSGMRAIPGTQMEAARALGMTYFQSMKDVLLPQAIRISIPALMNQTLGLFKSTSLAMAISVGEITYISQQINNETYRTFETFMVASIFYLVVSWIIMLVGYYYNKKHLQLKGR